MRERPAAALPDVVPKAPEYNPVAKAIARAGELGEEGIVAALRGFASMPHSTGILANPVRYATPVRCGDTELKLQIRAFTIRGIVGEWDIVGSGLSPHTVIFAGLYGRMPSPDEERALAARIDESFLKAIEEGIEPVAAFLTRYPHAEPATTIQYFSTLRKAEIEVWDERVQGLNDERAPGELLDEMLSIHMRNCAAGGLSAYMTRHLREGGSAAGTDLADATRRFVRAKETGDTAFSLSSSLLLGRPAVEEEREILERMGTIQIHHGSAGSNMVARYLTTLHARSIEDLFLAAQMALDSARHFGAIHAMSEFVNRLEALDARGREAAIEECVLHGGLPTFGHPEIAAAGRAHEIEQDPRPAIYIAPLFDAIDRGAVRLTPRQGARLAIARQIYRHAFVDGVVKPGRTSPEPLRLTPNTDFGAWCVQEALGVAEADRTLLTFLYRGFGWMMDVREQLQLKIIRPVIPPDPSLVAAAKTATDSTVPELVTAVHDRLATGSGFEPARS